MNKYIKISIVTFLSFLVITFLVNTLVGAAFVQTTRKAEVRSNIKIENNLQKSKTEEVIVSELDVIKVDPIAPKVKSESTCGKNWFKISNFPSKIDLDVSPLASWNAASNPTVVGETANNTNTVIIGHNRCKYGDCLRAYGQFAEIINSTTQDTGELCLNGEYFTGKVVFSNPVSQYDVHIMDNWLGKDTVTVFTCYGNCLDQNCNSTDQRFVVAFEKNP